MRTAQGVVTGMRSTGRLRLGHLVEALSQWTGLCATADDFFEITDVHAYTTLYADPQAIRDARNDMVPDWLAAGGDPKRSAFFLPSAVPQISELHVLLGMIVRLHGCNASRHTRTNLRHSGLR